MGKSNKGGKFGGGSRQSFSGGRGKDTGKPFSMHKAVCDECGQACEVPFRPTGDKPIYCSECFKGKRGEEPRRSDRPSFGDRGDRGDRQMFSAKCSECGQTCEVPFRPTGDKPVYCTSCFEIKKRGGSGDRERVVNKGGDQLNERLGAINIKLDKILKILSGEVVQENNPPKADLPRAGKIRKEEIKKNNEEAKKSVVGEPLDLTDKEIASMEKPARIATQSVVGGVAKKEVVKGVKIAEPKKVVKKEKPVKKKTVVKKNPSAKLVR